MKDLVNRRFGLRNREQGINMIHVLADDQFVRRIFIKHPVEFRHVRIEDFTGSHKHCDITDTGQVSIDGADMPVMNVKIAPPILCTKKMPW